LKASAKIFGKGANFIFIAKPVCEGKMGFMNVKILKNKNNNGSQT